MSRIDRLLQLMDILRRHRFPISGGTLAEELGISLRTLYRDMATLQGLGAKIEGEPGIGYILKPGFELPPLMFSEEELEALVLGARWVMKRTDSPLKAAARNALAKISAVLPDHLRDEPSEIALLVGPGEFLAGSVDLAMVRQAIRQERKVEVTYIDLQEQYSQRTLWPFALAFFDRVLMLAAWCELRHGFRHFRMDRIKELVITDIKYPKRRQVLLKEWQDSEKIPPQ